MNILTIISYFFVEHLGYCFTCIRPDLVLKYSKTPQKCIDNIELFLYFNKGLQIGLLYFYIMNMFHKKLIRFENFEDLNYFEFGLNLLLIICGQVLNLSVFNKLGRNGVYYGVLFGLKIPWCYSFPYNIKIIKHPQYVGAVLSGLGIFNIIKMFIINSYIDVIYSICLLKRSVVLNYMLMAFIESRL